MPMDIDQGQRRDGWRKSNGGLVKLARTFLRFGTVGLFVTGFNFVVFFALVQGGANYVVATIGGWLPSVAIAFFLNRRSTFLVKGSVKFGEFLNYSSANVLQLLLSLVVIAVLVDVFSVSLVAASLCNLVILPVFNFLVLRFFVFPEARQE